MAQVRYRGKLVEMPDEFCAHMSRMNGLFRLPGYRDEDLERRVAGRAGKRPTSTQDARTVQP